MARGGLFGARKRISASAKAGLTFPVTRIKNKLKTRAGKGMRVNVGAANYATAVLEYLTAEVMEIAGIVTKDNKLKRISPRHIAIAIWKDEELARLCNKVTFPSAGVVPHIDNALLSGPKAAKAVAKTTNRPKATLAAAAPQTVAKRQPPKKALTQGAKGKGGCNHKKGKGKGGVKNCPKCNPPKGGGVTTLGKRVLASGSTISVLSGDITDVNCEALTYSAGGQVASRVHTVGGAAFQNKENTTAKNYPNGVIISEAANLPSTHVIRCTAPVWNNNTMAKAVTDLDGCIKSCLRAADDAKLKSISFPSIGSGGAGYPKQTAAQTILKSISDYFKTTNKKSAIREVFFVLYDKQSVNLYVTELQRLVE